MKLLGALAPLIAGALLVIGALLYEIRAPLQRSAEATARVTGRSMGARTSSAQIGPGSSQTSYAVSVRYTYAVDGDAYQGQHSFNPAPWAFLARRTYDRYPEGAQIAVWYDPAAPGEAIPTRGVNWTRLLAVLAVGGGLLVWGGAGVMEALGGEG